MRDKKFNQEKSALLTALVSSLVTSRRVLEALRRHEARVPGPPDHQLGLIEDAVSAAQVAAERHRDAVEEES